MGTLLPEDDPREAVLEQMQMRDEITLYNTAGWETEWHSNEPKYELR